MKIVLADQNYSKDSPSEWMKALTHWVGSDYIGTGEIEPEMALSSLNLSSSEKYLCLIHGEPRFENWESQIKRKNLDVVVVRVSTKGNPPRVSNAGSVHICPYKPEEFKKSLRIHKFFDNLKKSQEVDLELLLKIQFQRIEALTIFLECIAFAKETHGYNKTLEQFNMSSIMNDSCKDSTECNELIMEISNLKSGLNDAALSECLTNLEKFAKQSQKSNTPKLPTTLLNDLNLDARTAYNTFTSILTSTL
jgi:hypothetical protein